MMFCRRLSRPPRCREMMISRHLSMFQPGLRRSSSMSMAWTSLMLSGSSYGVRPVSSGLWSLDTCWCAMSPMNPSLRWSRPGASRLNSVRRHTRHGTRIQFAIGHLLPRVGHGRTGVLLGGGRVVRLGVAFAGVDVRLGWGHLSLGIWRVGHRAWLLFFSDGTAATEIYTRFLHDALPSWPPA